MRDSLKRVTIVLLKDQHARYKENARRYHGSLSQFVRMACENEIRGDEKGDAFSLRPIVEKQEDISASVREISGKLGKVELGTEFLVCRYGSNVDKVSDEIETFLLNKGIGLSVPEIRGYLNFDQEEIVRGIERLEERFAVERVKQVNGPSKWKIRGDLYASE